MSQNPSPSAGGTATVSDTSIVTNLAETIQETTAGLLDHVGQAWEQDLSDALMLNPAVRALAEGQLLRPIQGLLDMIADKVTSFTPKGDVVQDILDKFAAPCNEVEASIQSAHEAVQATSTTAQWQGQAGQGYADQRSKQLDTLTKLAQVTQRQAQVSEGIAKANAAILTTVKEMIEQADSKVRGQLAGFPALLTFRRCVVSAVVLIELLQNLAAQVARLQKVQSGVTDASLTALQMQGTSQIGEHWPSVQG